MRIVLVNPNTFTKHPQPPLGLLTLATVCESKRHCVWIVDANYNKLSDQRISELTEPADVIGMTATSLSYPEAHRLAMYLRNTFPMRFMVLGGVHATLCPKEVIADGIFNSVVVGEGEMMGPVVFQHKVKGINEATQKINLDEIPVLDYKLLHNNFAARMPYGGHNRFVPVLTSRGCPYQCSFCSKAVFGKKYRVKSITGVMNELQTLINLGIKEVKFYDDLFTIDKHRAGEIADRINNRLAWSCMTRVSLVDKQTLAIMHKKGCHTISYGIESGDQRVLSGISKGSTVEEAEMAVRYSKEVGLKVIGYFMLGAPGETLNTIQRTVDFAISSGVDYAQFSIATALPGSELAEFVPVEQQANSYLMGGTVNPSLCELSPQQLQEELKRANKMFERGK